MLMSQKFADYYDGILSAHPVSTFHVPPWRRSPTFRRSRRPRAPPACRPLRTAIHQQGVHGRRSRDSRGSRSRSLRRVRRCQRWPRVRFSGCTTAAVRPKLAAVTCKGAKRATCLSVAQVTALERVFEGARNAAGAQLYSNWPWDAGIGGRSGDGYFQGWRAWRLGDFEAESVSSITTGLVAPSSAAMASPPCPSACGSAPRNTCVTST